MKRIALVLVAVLLVLMVGACGGEEAKPTETTAVTTEETAKVKLNTDLEKLFVNYVTAAKLGYKHYCDTVMSGLDEGGIFIDLEASDPGHFAKLYDRAVDFGGLHLTVGVGNVGEGDFLLAYAYEKDNTHLEGFSGRARQAEHLIAESFNDWDDEGRFSVVSLDNRIYMIRAQADPDKDQVVIIMSSTTAP